MIQFTYKIIFDSLRSLNILNHNHMEIKGRELYMFRKKRRGKITSQGETIRRRFAEKGMQEN